MKDIFVYLPVEETKEIKISLEKQKEIIDEFFHRHLLDFPNKYCYIEDGKIKERERSWVNDHGDATEHQTQAFDVLKRIWSIK